MTKSAFIRRQLLLNMASNYTGKLITLGTWFFLTPFILNRVGQSVYGLWMLASSVIAYGSLLDFGIGYAIAKYVAEFRARGQNEEARGLVTTSLIIYLAIGGITILSSIVLAPLFPLLFNISDEHHSTAVWLVLLSGVELGISFPCAAPISVLRGLQRFDLINVISSAGTLLVAAATVTVLLLGGGLTGMLAINIPITLLMQIPTVWLVQRTAPELRLSLRGAQRRHIRTVASFSSALFVINFAGQLKKKTDEIIIGAYLPLASVTPYSLARRLSEYPQMLTDQFLKLIMPLASQLEAENDQARLRSLYITGTRLALVFFLPIACGAVFLASPFLTAWVGASYAGYSGLVLILSMTALIETAQWPSSSILQGIAKHRLLALLTILSGLLKIGLSIFLVRRFGLMGVALGALVPAVLESFFFVIPYTLRVVGVRLRTLLFESFLPALGPALPMMLALYGLREIFRPASLLPIALIGGLGLLVYAAAYILFCAPNSERQIYYEYILQAVGFTRARLKAGPYP